MPSRQNRGALTALVGFAVLLSASLAVGFTLRDYSLSSIAAFYTPEAAVLSPALLRDDELNAAYRTATTDVRVQKALQDAGPAQRIVYVVPLEWCLPDLPLEATRTCYGHFVPASFDRRYYKLLFTRARTHAPQASG